jgi:hypothetical protein
VLTEGDTFCQSDVVYYRQLERIENLNQAKTDQGHDMEAIMKTMLAK